MILVIMRRKRQFNHTTKLISGIGTAIHTVLLLGLLLIASPTLAQDKSVSGTIKDPSGDPIPGATILEKGSQNGVIADFDGNFTIILTGDNPTLTISFVGYKTQEIEVGNRTTINVVLGEDVEELAEIIVVGYGTQEAKDVTGVVATVTPDDFNKGIIVSPENLISGKVAGVSVTPSTEPGGGSSIRIRGVTSLGSGQEPLYVVDGVILDNSGYGGGRNALNFINPSDIASMTILKDASAAAIYGSRGAAGVILITTKTGKEGKVQLTYDGYYSYSNPNKNFGFFSPSNFRAIVDLKAPQILPLLGTDNTVWVDEVIQPVSSQNHNISLVGGGKNTTYSISFNQMTTNGVVKNSQNKISRAALKLTTKALNDDLTLSVQFRSSFTKDNFSNNVTGTALAFDPTRPVFDAENDNYGGYWEWQQGLAPANPVSTINQIQNLGETRRNFVAINANYKVRGVEGLSLNVIGSADFRDGKSQFFRPTTHLAGLDSLGFMSVGVNTAYTYNFEPYISYKTHLESINSSLEVMLGYSYQEVGQESFGYSGNNLITNVFGFNNASIIDKTTLAPWRINPLQNQLQAYYGRVNFAYKDKYLLTSNLRYDGSTRFGPENRYGVFPSVALGWRMMEEDFFSFLDGTFTNLKFRVGWGKLGNQAIGNYLYEKFYFLSTNDARYQFGNTFYNMLRPTGVDPSVQWEETTTTNIGFDFGLLNNRLTGTLDFYNKQTSALLAEVAVPAFTNVSDVVTTNIAEMYNRGIELGLNTVIYDLNDFDWNLNFNVAWNKNEITQLDRGGPDSPGLERGNIAGDVGQTIKIWKVGEAYDAFYTYVRDPNGVSRGGETYQDVNGDGVINENDLQVVGKPAPDFIFGLTSSIAYKNFVFDFTLRSNVGNQIYNNTASANGYSEQLFQGGIINNIHESVLETGYSSRQLHSDFYIENGSFLTLDNVTIAYNYNKLSWLNARIYGTAQNLFTITGYSGPNPEIGNGIDNNLYPRASNYIIGLSLSF
jgi:TonB-dependent starch-binding outer membrane protein SusC